MALASIFATSAFRVDRGAPPPAAEVHSGTLSPNAEGFTGVVIHRAAGGTGALPRRVVAHAGGECTFMLDVYGRAPPTMRVRGLRFHGSSAPPGRGRFGAVGGSFIIERPGSGAIVLHRADGGAPLELAIQLRRTE